MRFQRALSVIGCGSLGFLTLVVAGCGSSNKNNNNDSSVDTGTSVDVHADTGNTDAPKDTPKADTGAVDKGGTDTNKADVPDTHGSICTGVAPSAPLISNFDMDNNATFGQFGVDPVTGGTYVKAAALDPEDFNNGDWHLSGTVFGQSDFFGIYWNCRDAASSGCTLDVSQWAGIQFDIKGNVGPDNQISFTMGRADDDTESENANCGHCVKAADAATTEDSCHGPRTVITVPGDGSTKTVTLHWADLTGGAPQSTIDPHQLTGILWFFHNPTATDGGTSTDGGATDAGATDAGAADGAVDAPSDGPSGPSYHVDFRIDNVTFLPF
jgi:hypothetical protein